MDHTLNCVKKPTGSGFALLSIDTIDLLYYQKNKKNLKKDWSASPSVHLMGFLGPFGKLWFEEIEKWNSVYVLYPDLPQSMCLNNKYGP